MSQVDVSIAYFGKPYQTLVSLLSLLKYSRQHIGTIHLTVECKQPHGDINGIYTVLEGLKNERVQLNYPNQFYQLGPLDYEQVRNDTSLRWSLPYQYALEKSTAPYLFILHNDMLFHADMIGAMLEEGFGKRKLAGAGSIGQCWSCPANWDKKCSGAQQEQYVPEMAEAIRVHEAHATPRQALDLEIIRSGRVYPLPECRLNEYACLVHVPTYRENTLPAGPARCFGGVWNGADLGTSWFYDMVNKGHRFQHFVLEDYALHSTFNPLGQGSQDYSKAESYRICELRAKDYLAEHYSVPQPGLATQLKMTGNTARYTLRKWAGKAYARLWKLVH